MLCKLSDATCQVRIGCFCPIYLLRKDACFSLEIGSSVSSLDKTCKTHLVSVITSTRLCFGFFSHFPCDCSCLHKIFVFLLLPLNSCFLYTSSLASCFTHTSASLGSAIPKDQGNQGNVALNTEQHDSNMFPLSSKGELNWLKNTGCCWVELQVEITNCNFQTS